MVCEPASSPRNFWSTKKTGSPGLYYKRISRKEPLINRSFYLQSSRQGLEGRFGCCASCVGKRPLGWFCGAGRIPEPQTAYLLPFWWS